MERDPPPPYKESNSMSRSRNARRSVQAAADSALRSAVARGDNAPPVPAPAPATAPADAPVAADPPAAAASPTTASTPRASASVEAPVSPTSAAAPVTPTSPTSPVSPVTPASLAPPTRRNSQPLPLMGSRAGRSEAEQERIRQLEEDQRRRELAGQRLLAERNQREGTGPTFLTRKEEKLRITQLQEEAREARRTAAAAMPLDAPSTIFKDACSTDLLFLIDRTHSMRPYLEAVKKQVKNIVNDILQAFMGEPQVRIAIVTYTDHGEKPNVRWLDFTRSTSVVFAFLDGLRTEGGDDIPEDVLGGVQQAIDASWSQSTRCLIHIADAPPHGRIFQDKPYRRDNYPEAGTEPHGLTHQPLLQRMLQLNINYFLLPIDNTTDRMAYCFSQVYKRGSAKVKLSGKNAHRDKADEPMDGHSFFIEATRSKRGMQETLLFVESEAGTINQHLRSLVVKSVLSSAPRSATRSFAHGQFSKSMAPRRGRGTYAIQEEADDALLEEVAPQWNTPGWLDETIRMEGFCPDVVLHGPKTLNNMMQSDDNIRMRVTDLSIQKRTRPFAQGAMRTAAYARTAYSSNPFVVKQFKREGKGLAHMTEDMQCQALCKAFALEFNALAGEKYSIDFIVTTSLQEHRRDSEKSSMTERKLLSLEPFIPGTYVKFTSNCGYVNDEIPDDPVNIAAQAFSHFSFERSQGRFLVCDLQGVGNVLTDPAIHTRDRERFQLTDCNLNEDGFKFFFATHECNTVCRLLKLQSTAAMLMANKFTFRESWPAKPATVCCANKLCGKIVRLDSAHAYRDFSWCESCFPQIHATMSRWPCDGHGLYHTFTASRFFYESQGRLTPRSCPTHQVRDEAIPRAPSEGGKLLNRLSFWSRKG